jgi:DNA-binding transcriptional ArsR family regulator
MVRLRETLNRLCEITDDNPYAWLMIQLRLAAGDLERMRFDLSPMVEVVQSGRMLSAGRSRPPYEDWYAEARARVRALDADLLALVLPGGPFIADFLVARPGQGITIDEHLHAIAGYPPDRLRDDLLVVWPGPRPPRLAELLADPAGAPRRVADVLHDYWSLLIEPHWRRIKAVLRDDLAYRATRLAADGVDGMLGDLHRELSVADGTLLIDKPRHDVDQNLDGAGLCLVPSVFSWPELIVMCRPGESADITYGCRAAGTVWGAGPPPLEDPLGALLGRTRAEVLRGLGQPRSTSDLAAGLALSMPAVSQHLGVLRRGGMVTSWRSGRHVLYQRTPLATSVLAANEDVTAVVPFRRE